MDESVSPTMSIRRVLATIAIAFALALLFGARGIVHAGTGMNDGPERTITLDVGQKLVSITDTLHLTWPWDEAQTALGRSPQPSTSPLLEAEGKPSGANPGGTKGGNGGKPQPPSNAGTGAGTRTPVPDPTTKTSGAGATDRPRATPVKTKTKGKPSTHLKPLRTPTRAHPLRLLITGDSLTEYMGPQLVDIAARAGPVQGNSDVHYGTGLVRPDFVDWSVVAQQQISKYHPEAIVVMMGGNDYQNITMPDGRIIDSLTPAWVAEYTRRAAVCMRIWAQNGKARVYWLSMPPARDPSWSHNNANINIALQRAAKEVPGVKYLNILGPVTDHGKYSDFVEYNGQQVLMRTPDGIHFTQEASDIVASEVLTQLKHDWHLGHAK